ncbi:hypothetical protein RRG08_044626 [Elysia crispata]|uniref:Uncharacterized protein n=1 Tax=Elysia crispata TaxID=231223 RepID=A0AAE0YM93_9GAST|nr:hypothetical protein RRG08_044626 [Elysia crispata]
MKKNTEARHPVSWIIFSLSRATWDCRRPGQTGETRQPGPLVDAPHASMLVIRKLVWGWLGGVEPSGYLESSPDNYFETIPMDST